MMHKRGLAPLIGTVLLIGFTVAIFAIIVVWGVSIFFKTTEKSERETRIQLDFALNVGIDIKRVDNVRVFNDGVGDDRDYVTIEIENTKDKGIEDFIIRLYAYDTVYNNLSIGKWLGPFEIKRFNVYFPGYDSMDFYAQKVDVIPLVKDPYGILQAASSQKKSKLFLCAFSSKALRGDFNNDGLCNVFDINTFQDAIDNREYYNAQYPCVEKDLNCDGEFDKKDIDTFSCILGDCLGCDKNLCEGSIKHCLPPCK